MRRRDFLRAAGASLVVGLLRLDPARQLTGEFGERGDGALCMNVDGDGYVRVAGEWTRVYVRRLKAHLGVRPSDLVRVGADPRSAYAARTAMGRR